MTDRPDRDLDSAVDALRAVRPASVERGAGPGPAPHRRADRVDRECVSET